MNVHAEYIVDEHLNKKSVIIPYSEWMEIVEEMEELDDIRAYDQAKQEAGDEVLDFDQAVAEIKAGKIE
ncbi:hypothetical protein [Thiocystis violascens]|uniref:Uncharacterized protein n=1 Tax=Thiocystis violascens (strain ATCC 17096 / DSM 198 / 6111) TaxID=765911 RepID=I3Y968_THIV6|nr:hypothetical protein [Thiocystis violascens]AFL73536.1 hypothetical protein Thivi_1544 [Thiocystis violascens DSM 198]